MAFYRLYFVHGGTRVDRFHQFEALGDDDAIRRAEMFRAGRAMELWKDDRLVKRWEETSHRKDRPKL